MCEENEVVAKRIIKWTCLSLGTILVICTGFASCHVVPPGHRGVRITLGSVGTEPLPEGLAFKAPWLAQIKDVSVQQTMYEDKAPAFSSDLQNVTVGYGILIKVPPAQTVILYRDYAGTPYTSLVGPRLQEAIKQATALQRAEQIVKSREEIRRAALERVRKAVGAIVEVMDLNIVNLDLSEEMEKSIEQKVVQEQLALAKAFELQKEQKEAEITIVKAKAEAESVRIRGQALKESPQVVELEVVKKWDGKAPSTLVVGRGEGAQVVLPIGGK